jgi:hypothetical protein
MPSVEAIANTTKRWLELTPAADRWRSATAAPDRLEAASVGLAEVIVNEDVFELDPPDAAFEIETRAIPTVATLLAEICALAVVVPVMVVGVTGTPFQKMTEPVVPLAKFVPVTVSVKAELPAPMFEGESCVIVGAGGVGGLIEKRITFDTVVVVVAFVPEVPETAEPGIWTCTRAVPAVAIKEAGTIAVSWLSLTIVVAS